MTLDMSGMAPPKLGIIIIAVDARLEGARFHSPIQGGV